MSNFIKDIWVLMVNELVKQYKKISTYIWLAVIIGSLFVMLLFIKPALQSSMISVNDNIKSSDSLSQTVSTLRTQLQNREDHKNDADFKTSESILGRNWTDDEAVQLKALADEADKQVANKSENDGWKNNVYIELINTKVSLLGMDESSLKYDDMQAKNYQKTISIDRYRLDKNIAPILMTPPTDTDLNQQISAELKVTPAGFMHDYGVNIASLLISIFAIFMAGSIVASEFSRGTIKFLMIAPYKRWKILWAKYKTVFLNIFIATLLTYLTTYILAATVFGGYGLGQQYVYYSFGYAHSMPFILYMFIMFLLSMVWPLLLATISMMISTLTRNSALSTTLGIALTFLPGMATTFLQSVGSGIVKYLPFNYANLTSLESYLFNTPVYGLGEVTFTFTIIVLIVYFVCINAITFDSFCRRDVKQ